MEMESMRRFSPIGGVLCGYRTVKVYSSSINISCMLNDQIHSDSNKSCVPNLGIGLGLESNICLFLSQDLPLGL